MEPFVDAVCVKTVTAGERFRRVEVVVAPSQWVQTYWTRFRVAIVYMLLLAGLLFVVFFFFFWMFGRFRMLMRGRDGHRKRFWFGRLRGGHFRMVHDFPLFFPFFFYACIYWQHKSDV